MPRHFRTLVKKGVHKKYNMVNTFLPRPNYAQSAQDLDYKRLGKQRVEAFQILRANLGLTQGWRNHPAAVMWRGYEGALCEYTLAICDEWIARGYNDSIRIQVIQIMESLPQQTFQTPWWLGIPELHESHQSNLRRKNPIYYNYSVPDDISYKWPRQDRTIKTKEQIHEDQVLLQDKQGRRKRRSVAGNSKRKGARSAKRRTTKAGTRKRMVKPSSS